MSAAQHPWASSNTPSPSWQPTTTTDHICPPLPSCPAASLAQLTDAGLAPLRRHPAYLQHLDLRYCTLLSDAALTHLTGGWAEKGVRARALVVVVVVGGVQGGQLVCLLDAF